ncbi:MAG: hypothetical protein AAB391_02915 [Patescibacteria group bacterium]
MATEGKGFEQSDVTSLDAIRTEVAGKFEDNPEGAYQTLKGYLDAAVDKRRTALKQDLLADPEISADDSLAFTDLLNEALRRACADDVEIQGITNDMRSIREEQAAQAAAEERKRDRALEESNMASAIAKLQDFRDNLERLGLDTTKEDAALASLERMK